MNSKLLYMRIFLNNRQIYASWQAKAPFHQHWGTSFPNYSRASALSTCLSKVCCHTYIQISLSPSAPDAALDTPSISTFQGRVSDCDTACHAMPRHLINQSCYLDNPSNAINSSGKFQRVQPTTLAELSTPFAPSGCMLSRMKKRSSCKKFHQFGQSLCYIHVFQTTSSWYLPLCAGKGEEFLGDTSGGSSLWPVKARLCTICPSRLSA